jgi:hypothetical protein
LLGERKKKKHKQSITEDNPTIICLHLPHHMKEDTASHPVRRRMARFGHRKASYTSS